MGGVTASSPPGVRRMFTQACVGAGQKWIFEHGRVQHVDPFSATPLCLDLESNSTANGENLVLRTCSTSPLQQWQFHPRLNNLYLASEVHGSPEKCMDLRNGEEYGQLQIWDCMNGTWNQQWVAHGDVNASTMQLIV